MNKTNTQGIAFFVQSVNLSGAEKRVVKLAERLSSMGLPVLIFMDSKTSEVYRQSRYLDNTLARDWKYPLFIRITSIGRCKCAKIRRVFGLENLHLKLVHRYWCRQFMQEGIAVSHVFLNPTICRDLPGPKIYEITSPDMARVLEKKAAAFSGDFFPPETLLRPNSESVAAALGPALRRCRVQTAETALFIPDSEKEASCRDKENLIIFAHRLVPRKNPLLFAEAVKQFLTRNPVWKIGILGEGEQRARVIQSLEEEIKKKPSRSVFCFKCARVSNTLKNICFHRKRG